MQEYIERYTDPTDTSEKWGLSCPECGGNDIDVIVKKRGPDTAALGFECQSCGNVSSKEDNNDGA